MKEFSTLKRVVREHLEASGLDSLLEEQACDPPESAYDDCLERAARSARRLARQVNHAQEIAAARARLLLELTEAQREMFLANSCPAVLVVLARFLAKRSFEERFGDTQRGLLLAELALRVARLAVTTDYLSPESGADLLAEVHIRLGNARRVSSDFEGARRGLARAREYAEAGTRDRLLWADLLSAEGYLACNLGDGREAIALAERETKLRSLLGDDEEFGRALIHRGWLGCWLESLESACGYLREGVLHCDDPRIVTVGLCALALRLVRDGDGPSAWRTLATAHVSLLLTGDRRLKTEHRWVSALALVELGEVTEATRELLAVRTLLRKEGSRLAEGFCSLDLACIEIRQGDYASAMRFADRAREIFVALRVGQPILAALLTLAEAIRKGHATVTLATKVAHFARRYQLDRRASLNAERT